MKLAAMCCLALSLSVVAPARAQGMGGMDMKGMDHKGMKMDGKKSAATSHKGVGVVKNVDAAKGTVSLAHEPIQSMNWPAMTMTFKAKDKKMLEHLKPGNRIEFGFVQQGKDYVITSVK